MTTIFEKPELVHNLVVHLVVVVLGANVAGKVKMYADVCSDVIPWLYGGSLRRFAC